MPTGEPADEREGFSREVIERLALAGIGAVALTADRAEELVRDLSGNGELRRDEVRQTIGYIERNPLKIGLPPQAWPFVQPYDNWPLHPGHSPNSPYSKRLRAAGRL